MFGDTIDSQIKYYSLRFSACSVAQNCAHFFSRDFGDEKTRISPIEKSIVLRMSQHLSPVESTVSFVS